jgi:hypothetical protein
MPDISPQNIIEIIPPSGANSVTVVLGIPSVQIPNTSTLVYTSSAVPPNYIGNDGDFYIYSPTA